MDSKLKNKKVCHLTSVHPRYDTRIFVKECVSLLKNGYDVSLVVADGKGDEEKNGVKIFDVGKIESRRKRMLHAPKKVLQKALAIDADLYHFHDPELLTISRKLIKKYKKVVYDVHEDVPRQILSKSYLNSFVKPIISRVFEKYENRKAAKLSYIITATDFIKDRFLKLTPNAEAVKNYPIISELKIDTDWTKKMNKACYIGSFSEVRGIWEIVKSFEFSEYRLNLAGKFGSSDFEAKVQSLPSWQKVDFHGFVGRQEVRGILESSKVGLVTLHKTINYKDALPVKMFEYMLAGIPVIASDIELWQKIVNDNKCGICVEPMNPKEIAKAVNYLIENDELAYQMGQNGRKAVEEKFNWNNEEQILLETYKKILEF